MSVAANMVEQAEGNENLLQGPTAFSIMGAWRHAHIEPFEI